MNNERGAYFVKFIFLFVSLGALAGLAIDAGRLYMTQVRLQAAIDSGTISAIVLPRLHSEDYLEATAREVIAANLSQRGLDPARATIDVAVAAAGTITSAGVYPVDLTISRAFVTQRAQVPVSARAVGGLGPVTVALALDATSSMSTVAACDPSDPCYRNDWLYTIPSPPERIAGCQQLCYLKRAAVEFVNKYAEFSSANDQLAIISYSSDASTLFPFQSVSEEAGQGTAHSQAIAAINSLSADGGTCIACGIHQSREEYKKANLSELSNRFLVVMTDGAANVLHLGSEQTAATSTCGITHSGIAGERTDQNVREASYQAIVQADQARLEGITIHSIGLGVPLAEAGQDCALPYQENTGTLLEGACPENIMREPLLERLANDRDGFQHPFLPANEVPADCTSPYADDESCACMPRVGSGFRSGEFLSAAKGSELIERFRQVLSLVREPRLIE